MPDKFDLFIKKQKNGDLVVPLRADNDSGLIGDGVITIKPNDKEYKKYLELYNHDLSVQP